MAAETLRRVAYEAFGLVLGYLLGRLVSFRWSWERMRRIRRTMEDRCSTFRRSSAPWISISSSLDHVLGAELQTVDDSFFFARRLHYITLHCIFFGSYTGVAVVLALALVLVSCILQERVEGVVARIS